MRKQQGGGGDEIFPTTAPVFHFACFIFAKSLLSESLALAKLGQVCAAKVPEPRLEIKLKTDSFKAKTRQRVIYSLKR